MAGGRFCKVAKPAGGPARSSQKLRPFAERARAYFRRLRGGGAAGGGGVEEIGA